MHAKSRWLFVEIPNRLSSSGSMGDLAEDCRKLLRRGREGHWRDEQLDICDPDGGVCVFYI